MRYPKKYKNVKTLLKFPVKIKGKWFACKLTKKGVKKDQKGSIIKFCIGTYELEQHCWIICNAHNDRVGYTRKEVKKLIKKFKDGEENKKTKKGKKKSKKGKKGKANKTPNKAKTGSKKRFFRNRQN